MDLTILVIAYCWFTRGYYHIFFGSLHHKSLCSHWHQDTHRNSHLFGTSKSLASAMGPDCELATKSRTSCGLCAGKLGKKGPFPKSDLLVGSIQAPRWFSEQQRTASLSYIIILPSTKNSFNIFVAIWLRGIPTPLKKYEFVSWDDEIPNIMESHSKFHGSSSSSHHQCS